MGTKLAAADNPTAESAPRDTPSDADSRREREEPRMIGDFDGSASKFWKLFKDEAKSHDEDRVYSLREDMKSALLFVRSYSLRITDLVMLMHGSTGWFIFRRPHSVRTRQQTRLEGQARR
jgi:hypothetical protein